jgi:hypothetical protein
MIGTFKIVARADGGFDAIDTCDFNNWGLSTGHVTRENAESYARWAHAFKTGRTFSGLSEYTVAHGA